MAIIFGLIGGSPAEASSWNHNNNNNSPWIQQAFQRYGISKDECVLPCGLEYPIFSDGKSALRSLPESCRSMVERELLKQDEDNNNNNSKSKVALLLLLAGYGDAAHDVLLGTTFGNLPDAEYAATHRGQTNWAKEHPLSDIDDVLHSIIHRVLEGSRPGEGGYTGYENAQYWSAGGPKQYEQPIVCKAMLEDPNNSSILLSKVYRGLCASALLQAPICVSRGVLATKQRILQQSAASLNEKGEGVTHTIIAGGGKFRTVLVPAEGCWDPIAFCQLLLLKNEEANKCPKLQSELEYLTKKELELLTKFLLLSEEE